MLYIVILTQCKRYETAWLLHEVMSANRMVSMIPIDKHFTSLMCYSDKNNEGSRMFKGYSKKNENLFVLSYQVLKS